MADIYGLGDEENTLLEHTCRLSFSEPAKHYRLTGIIATISKASRSEEILTKMVLAGMTIARLNFAYESHELHKKTIETIRLVSEECTKELGYNVQVAIALDTRGPEIRTGYIEAGRSSEVELKTNDNFRLSVNRDLMDKGTKDAVYVDYANIINIVVPGNFIFINDGALKLIVKEVGVDVITCQIERGGPLGSRKKVTLPGIAVDLPAISEKDRSDLKFGIEHNIDMVFASSIRSAEAIHELRSILGEKGKEIQIIAKIDNLQALENIDEILASADGILFARADIAVEIPQAKVFLAQKAIAARCNRVGKPIIIATQFLQTMTHKNLPMFVEVTDLGNAVLDGADCVMLSSETALGKFPVETVTTMATIVREAELAVWYRNLFEDLLARNPSSIDAVHSVAISAVDAAKKTMASGIIVLTTSGRSAFLLAKYRPRCPILAVTKCSRAFRHSYLHRGVVPILYTEANNENWIDTVDARIQYAMNVAHRKNIMHTGDTVVIVSPWKDGGGFTNNMRLVYAYFEQDDIECLTKIRRSTKKVPI